MKEGELMSESGRISVNYVVNASEFNKNITQMKENLQLCTQEVKNSAKEINLYGNNIQTLTSKQKAINTLIEKEKNKQKGLETDVSSPFVMLE